MVSEMDKSWMHSDRRSKAYEFGVEAFLNFAVENLLTTTHIRCPCVKCVNLKLFGVGIIRDHVYFNGIDQSYKNWTFHGEPWEATTNASRNVEEDDGHSRYSFVSEEIDMDDNDFGDFGSDPYEFANVIGDGDQPVYPGDLLPEGNTIPTSMYEAKKTLCALGLSYEKMHACPNDCILYRKEYEDSTNCPTCGISRWKEGKDSILKEGVPAKVTAKSLTWHAARKSIDGQMSHPADSPSWKLLDDKWPEFGNEPRNLRLALSSDGFNPHSSLSSRYSCWPVILVTYNLPPWLCMKRKFMMLTLLISGPKQPGNDIDVYLEPLIDDLKSLWVGIRGVYDAHNGEYFTLRAALMWTINDFPAYGNLSGCVVKGYKACPICGDDTPSHRLKNGHKICYIGHRKWLPINHPYRRQRAAFNGKPEYGIPPEPLTGEEVLHMVENGDRVCWKKKSIFFDLEYWKYLPVRHALDVMHIEKNVCDSIIGTLLEIPGKNKDGIAARLDLLNMGSKLICNRVWRKTYSFASWALEFVKSREERDSRLLGLKSHDCHTLMQQLLPVAIRSVCGEACKIYESAEGVCSESYSSEGCIAERWSAFKPKMGVSKPLSGCTVSVVDQDLLNQAHLYVLENTEEVLPYIEQHMIHIKTAYPKFRKRTKWLQDKHNSTFIQWLRFKVQSELEEDNHGVSENLRWLAAGPNMAVPLYRSYLIKGIKFNIKAQDDVRTTQNSGVYLLAHTMQVASAKDKNPILSNMGFYGVIQEIWDLDYQSLQSQSLVDELGFTLVDLSKIGHRNDQFVLASQVKQIFFVDDPMHRGWSVVLSMPNREYNDVIGDEVLGDVIIECEPFTRGMPNVDTFDELVGELGGQNIRDGCEDIWIE
ncbi:transposable element gene [Prunus dulcis]|uniref:Transposable element protein n=1 Tax=Prunus dulcis TaxID=3755 RepID=A0A5H2Y5D2_PRUDU|nr:transposable element gene [Prunus dulcis]